MAYLWCDTNDAIGSWLDSLAPGSPMYLDTEFMRERTFWPELALVQVHDGDAIRLIDTPRITPAALAPLFRQHTLVMHACSEDLEAIASYTGAYPAAIEDTQIAAALTGEDMQLGYQKVVQMLLGVELPKGATRTNWLKRPLSEEQLHYAEDDVKYLPQVTSILRERLTALGRMDWWQEECDRLLAQASREELPEDAWRGVKGAGLLPDDARAVLSVLAPWRNRMARERNLPKSFVIKDAQLLDLARARGGHRGILADVGLHPKSIRRDGEALLALIAEGQQVAPPPPLPGPPDAHEKKMAKALRSKVGQVADQVGLKPDVLMRRRWLESLIRNPERVPEPLTGWRNAIITQPLLELL
ncbi:MAG: ribonuclease D [Pseudomonadota bacterium]|uniref:ribonuclease D n=1 Tax=Alcanivorax sp. TaxID=1872427 RepID=UPI002438D406|nr:ribonuclease D [Alcanivorax sp.]MED5238882.1 ribonuclease D [Pseudomonadota bacterium]MEE3320015.1 ribonuclease D [Pseudomonadota bacterium]